MLGPCPWGRPASILRGSQAPTHPFRPPTVEEYEMSASDPRQRLEGLLAERILVLDGAMGTMVQTKGLELRRLRDLARKYSA